MLWLLPFVAPSAKHIKQHTIVRSLPNLRELYALQINFILEAGTPPVSMTGIAISSQHHYGGTVIEPHTSASATMLHELRQCVIDSMSHCKDTTQLEWIGFSWLTEGRHQNHLDGEGNPYVFLSKVIREPEVDSEDEDEDGAAQEKKQDEIVESEAKAEVDLPIRFWVENDLNISQVPGVRMWDKEIWAGRL